MRECGSKQLLGGVGRHCARLSNTIEKEKRERGGQIGEVVDNIKQTLPDIGSLPGTAAMSRSKKIK